MSIETTVQRDDPQCRDHSAETSIDDHSAETTVGTSIDHSADIHRRPQCGDDSAESGWGHPSTTTVRRRQWGHPSTTTGETSIETTVQRRPRKRDPSRPQCRDAPGDVHRRPQCGDRTPLQFYACPQPPLRSLHDSSPTRLTPTRRPDAPRIYIVRRNFCIAERRTKAHRGVNTAFLFFR